MNTKLTSIFVLGGVVAFSSPLPAVQGPASTNGAAAARVKASSTSDADVDSSNPYAIIVDRNVFRLNPPPPPPVVEEKPKDLPKVYLSGIIKIGDDVKVLFSIPSKDAKTPTSYFKLGPGERDGDLELVKIHPDQQYVDVVVSGTSMTLSMLSNTLASAGNSPAGGGAAPGLGGRAAKGLRAGKLAAAAEQAPAAPTPMAAAAPRGASSVIVGGDDRGTSGYGGVTVAGGGGGITTIGGGNSSTFGGGSGVAVSGGSGSSSFGSSSGASAFGGGTTVAGGSSTSLGGTTAASGTGANIGNLLTSSGSAQIANTPTQPTLSLEQQELAMGAYAALHSDAPPLPPAVQAAVDGVPYTPPNPKAR